jgi:hypothetical protein
MESVLSGDTVMPETENVISRIIDLDERAELIQSGAREEAGLILTDAGSLIADEKRKREERIADRIREIEAEAATVRANEIESVRKENRGQVEAIEHTSTEKVRSAVNLIVSRIRGNAE